ncbi:MAG TPA: IS3 family transposase, partial [Thermopetrobacter sp.]|nr:IS3 family transposase [Thermopetrobacter sp.]
MADLTYVAAGKGFAHAAFVIDAFSRRRVGRRVMDSLKAELALEGLEQAIVARAEANELIHH